MEFTKLITIDEFFEIELNENDEQKAKNAVKQMCEKLLANLIIEDFKISKTK